MLNVTIVRNVIITISFKFCLLHYYWVLVFKIPFISAEDYTPNTDIERENGNVIECANAYF